MARTKDWGTAGVRGSGMARTKSGGMIEGNEERRREVEENKNRR